MTRPEQINPEAILAKEHRFHEYINVYTIKFIILYTFHFWSLYIYMLFLKRITPHSPAHLPVALSSPERSGAGESRAGKWVGCNVLLGASSFCVLNFFTDLFSVNISH